MTRWWARIGKFVTWGLAGYLGALLLILSFGLYPVWGWGVIGLFCAAGVAYPLYAMYRRTFAQEDPWRFWKRALVFSGLFQLSTCIVMPWVYFNIFLGDCQYWFFWPLREFIGLFE